MFLHFLEAAMVSYDTINNTGTALAPIPTPVVPRQPDGNYDDVVVMSSYDVVGGGEESNKMAAKKFRPCKNSPPANTSTGPPLTAAEGYGKPPPLPPPISSENLMAEYSVVSGGAVVMGEKEGGLPDYNVLMHQQNARQHSASVADSTSKPLLECYSKLGEMR